MLTSRNNPEFKELLKLKSRKQRFRQQAFVAEGLRLVEDGLAAGWTPLKLVVSPPLLNPSAAQLVNSWDYPRLELAPELMQLAGDTETSQGIMAVFPLPQYELGQIQGGVVLVLDGLRDPGNVGSLLRSGAAAGVDGIIALDGTVDITAPKVVRASMGGVFRVNWIMDVKTDQVVQWANDTGCQLLCLDPHRGEPFHSIQYPDNMALVVGGETQGVREQVSQAAQVVTIPMPGGHESLNASMAATLVLYQALIQRGL